MTCPAMGWLAWPRYDTTSENLAVLAEFVIRVDSDHLLDQTRLPLQKTYPAYQSLQGTTRIEGHHCCRRHRGRSVPSDHLLLAVIRYSGVSGGLSRVRSRFVLTLSAPGTFQIQTHIPEKQRHRACVGPAHHPGRTPRLVRSGCGERVV